MINITDPRARVLYQAEMDRQMTVLENVQIREIKPVLNRQYMRVAKFVSQGILLDGVDHAVDRDSVRLTNLLSRHYRRIATVFGDKVFKVIEESREKGTFPSQLKTPRNEFWGELNRWMTTQAGMKIRHIQKTTKRNIAAVIQRGMNESESHRTIARNIRKNGRITTPRRAIKIARTETHTAAVKSVNAAMASTRLKFEREWVAAHDERTRINHMAADGERIAQDDVYRKTGEHLRYPGDPNGSPGNIIFCRCVEIFHTVKATGKSKHPKQEGKYVFEPIKE